MRLAIPTDCKNARNGIIKSQSVETKVDVHVVKFFHIRKNLKNLSTCIMVHFLPFFQK